MVIRSLPHTLIVAGFWMCSGRAMYTRGMSTKTLIWAGLVIGSSLGSYLPTLFGQDMFSGWAILWSAIGSILGVWAGYKIGQNYSME